MLIATIERQSIEEAGGRPRPVPDPVSIRLSDHFRCSDFFNCHGSFIGLIDMRETYATTVDVHAYKLVCEQCGSLTVVLPIEVQPDPRSVLKCGRCGSPKGTLQSLRERSIEAGIGHPG